MHKFKIYFSIYLFSFITVSFVFQAFANNDIKILQKKYDSEKIKYQSEYLQKIEDLNKNYVFELNKLASSYTISSNKKGLEAVRKELKEFEKKRNLDFDNPFSSDSRGRKRKHPGQPQYANTGSPGQTGAYTGTASPYYTGNPYTGTANPYYTGNPYTGTPHTGGYTSGVPAWQVPANAVINIPPASALAFTESGFSGSYQLLSGPAKYDIYQLAFGQNTLMSIKLAPYTMAVFYKNPGFRMPFKTVYEDIEDISKLGGPVSSIEICRYAAFFRNINFSGSKSFLKIPGKYGRRELGIGNDKLSSLIVPPGAKVVLYEHDGFTGKSVTYYQGEHAFVNDFNDLTSSIEIFSK